MNLQRRTPKLHTKFSESVIKMMANTFGKELSLYHPSHQRQGALLSRQVYNNSFRIIHNHNSNKEESGNMEESNNNEMNNIKNSSIN